MKSVVWNCLECGYSNITNDDVFVTCKLCDAEYEWSGNVVVYRRTDEMRTIHVRMDKDVSFVVDSHGELHFADSTIAYLLDDKWRMSQWLTKHNGIRSLRNAEFDSFDKVLAMVDYVNEIGTTRKGTCELFEEAAERLGSTYKRLFVLPY